MNTIQVPCKTGDPVWFADQWGFASWGKVVGFTETHIIVDSTFTEYRKRKELLPISEWNISIFLSSEDINGIEELKKLILDRTKRDEQYYKDKGFQCRELSMKYYIKGI